MSGVPASSKWTEVRVDETVTPAYIRSQLRPNEQDLLQRTLYFGGDLTDDTYLDRILAHAKRFFLILVAAGVPEQIFGIIDDSYDDEDLPIADYAVPELRLSYEPDSSLDKRFYKAQFRFLTRIIGEGEHIRYADEETVPIISLSLKSMVLARGHERTDRVRLMSESPRTLMRRRIVLDSKVSEEDILLEIAGSRKLCHEHIASVFGSYLHQGIFNILSLPAVEWTLKTFLTDTPKAFTSLDKIERRKILITWPHCLASALAWLHGNGESHGAIRPSNIQVDNSFNIYLGLLAGDGELRDMAQPNDIETYQYGPPERWKRAVMVQSTGSSAIMLPSGGRSGRSIRNNNRDTNSNKKSLARSGSTSSTATYTFQPTSKGNYARLRLRMALGPHATPPSTVQGRTSQSHSDTQRTSTKGTRQLMVDTTGGGYTPSVISSNSSTGQQSSSIFGGPIFVSAPESRSAVVQTWQSVEDDKFASDVFSLGAVLMDIVNLLCKRSYSSFARHRSARNRLAGRGGGLADASYHANLSQIALWAESLGKEAYKKAESDKDESRVYHAVGPVIRLSLQCLERDPSARLTSDQLEARLYDCIRRYTGIPHLHCPPARGSRSPPTVDIPNPVKESKSSKGGPQNNVSLNSLRQDLKSSNSRDAERQEHHQHVTLPHSQTLQTDRRRNPPSIHTTPRTASISSQLSFDFDGFSDTIVAEMPHSREPSLRRRGGRAGPPVLGHEVPWSYDQDSPQQTALWELRQRNEGQVDPRLSFGESVDTGAFTYINYSSSASSEEDVKFMPPSPSYYPPPSAAPSRALPPVPPLLNEVRSSRPGQQAAPNGNLQENVALLAHLSNLATGGHPPRMDSLPKILSLKEEGHRNSPRHTPVRSAHAVKASSRGPSRHGDGLDRPHAR
ncbi:serine/threonine protein kinase [Capronia coronata CBS 617.96]|uniref:Serine/threonine protein kinase n=1 Tax=Capronia coronata CBS 617.96 TaxID=1182541 RepID=W9YZJ7_9EURO|nr:serine/threonine protein kinase [Capronia coronata CBS 617.96]EXJ87724.1 serine/threonine protein kinase [Capronia coronata CBS 617.96]